MRPGHGRRARSVNGLCNAARSSGRSEHSLLVIRVCRSAYGPTRLFVGGRPAGSGHATGTGRTARIGDASMTAASRGQRLVRSRAVSRTCKAGRKFGSRPPDEIRNEVRMGAATPAVRQGTGQINTSFRLIHDLWPACTVTAWDSLDHG